MCSGRFLGSREVKADWASVILSLRPPKVCSYFVRSQGGGPQGNFCCPFSSTSLQGHLLWEGHGEKHNCLMELIETRSRNHCWECGGDQLREMCVRWTVACQGILYITCCWGLQCGFSPKLPFSTWGRQRSQGARSPRKATAPRKRVRDQYLDLFPGGRGCQAFKLSGTEGGGFQKMGIP